MSSIPKYGPMRNYIRMYERKNHSMPRGLCRRKSLEMPMRAEHLFSLSKKGRKKQVQPRLWPGDLLPLNAFNRKQHGGDLIQIVSLEKKSVLI